MSYTFKGVGKTCKDGKHTVDIHKFMQKKKRYYKREGNTERIEHGLALIS